MLIKKFDFNESLVQEIKKERFGKNWPVVYIINNENEFYIGETTHAHKRISQHLKDSNRKNLKFFTVISNELFNKSATLDIESSLIRFFDADGKSLQNNNKGLSEHNYYDKEKYQTMFEKLWDELKKRNIVKQDLIQLKNTDIFKYSPYKALTPSQFEVADALMDDIKSDFSGAIKVSGSPGTGKSILAVYLVKYLKDSSEYKHLKVGLVVPMTSFRNILKKVFKNVKGLQASMVIGPNEVVKQDFDVLIVDEAHRLKQRKNLTNYGSFDQVNKKLNLGNEGTHLDWIKKNSKKQILFYDAHQSIHPSDVDFSSFEFKKEYALTSQIRVKGGDEYISFIENFLNANVVSSDFDDYDFKLFDDLQEMISSVCQKNSLSTKDFVSLSRLLAGYAWDWKSKKNPADYDIVIGDIKLRWNSEASDWANSPNAINEVGCIHTIQGYDLNYAGVIIGPELSYDFDKKELIIHKDKYKDKKGKAAVDDEKEIKRYILNIYRVLLTRGIYGTYVYVCDPNLRKYLKSLLPEDSSKVFYSVDNSSNHVAIAEKPKKKY